MVFKWRNLSYVLIHFKADVDPRIKNLTGAILNQETNFLAVNHIVQEQGIKCYCDHLKRWLPRVFTDNNNNNNNNNFIYIALKSNNCPKR